MAGTLMQEHLRQYTKDLMNKKFRMDNALKNYRKQGKKSQDRIIDEGDLIAAFESQTPLPVEQIEVAKARKARDEVVWEEAKKIATAYAEDLRHLMKDLQYHIVELTDIEFTVGGFIAHTIVHDNHTQFDKESMTIKFTEDTGRAEIVIGCKQDSWKDSSQLKIIPKQK